ncbi:hypothetical protein BC826DRAFT_1102568 [Russula brevipes]|nr:hypothetical protein BC826DRAFT_1102568 [Russula brevipes]
MALASPQPRGEEEKRQVTSFLGSVANQVTSDAGSIFTDATSLGGEVATKVTCTSPPPFARRFHEPFYDVLGVIAIGGQVFTEITSAGGAAITLAGSGAGVVTTFAGSVYTVATAAAASTGTGTGNAAVANVRSLHISAPVLAALATTAGGVILGAWVAI